MAASKDTTISALMEKVINESEGDKIEIGEIVEIIGARGFGPLLLLPTIVTLLPTGALPFVPAICGIFIICISLQIAIGRKEPWLPKFLKEAGLSKEKFETSFKNKKSFIRKIDNLLDRRLQILTKETSQRIAGAVISLLALGMIFIGFIPFAPDFFALPILFFALGYMSKDGLLVLMGYIGVAVALGFMPWMIGQI